MRLLFLYRDPSSFVQEDLALLSEQHEVRTFRFGKDGRMGGRDLLRLAWQQLRWLWRELPHADLVFGWFADYHLALPVLLARRRNKPVVVALGGFDAHHLPELGYGVYHSRWRAPLARYVLRQSTLLLPVTAALIETTSTFATWPQERPNGLRVNVPGLQTPLHPLPTGYDPEAWPMGPDDRPPVVCTVAYLGDVRTLRLKGIDLVLAVAPLLPEAVFQIVGVTEALETSLRAQFAVAPNVRLLPPQPRAALPEVYANAAVYLQLARSEGLPNVVCEAMLCGCIPVGSPVGGIPEAIGDAGFVVPSPVPETIAAALRQALNAPPTDRRRARNHIARHFSRSQRRTHLFALLEALVQTPPPSR